MKTYIEQVTQEEDPKTIDELEEARFAKAIREGEQAVAEGRVQPANEVFAEIRAKHGF